MSRTPGAFAAQSACLRPLEDFFEKESQSSAPAIVHPKMNAVTWHKQSYKAKEHNCCFAN
jgi:hypothetical protein